MSNKQITDYFSKKKKTNVSIVENKDEDDTVQSTTELFYRECLEAKKTKCNQQQCVELKSALESQIRLVQIKCKNTKEVIETCQCIISQKDDEIAALNKIIESLSSSTEAINVPSTSVASANSILSSTEFEQQKDTLDFIEFANYFNESQLSELRSFGASKSEDSSFVNLALRSLYEGRLETLDAKTITGRGRTGIEKGKMTPKKIEIIEEIFQKRLQHSSDDSNERICRKKRLNKLIKDAKCNIAKSIKKKRKKKKSVGA